MSRYIYGVHEPNPLVYEGWVVHTVAVGRDPFDGHGWDFRAEGKTPLVRINHGYGRAGTIPKVDHFGDFAQRCANVVAASSGCSRWIIGNEMNHEQERPDGEAITPGLYGACFRMCRTAIRGVPGHEGDEVIVGAVAPWNVQTTYAGNAHGDWILYFRDVLEACGEYDGIALHTYSRSQQANVVVSEARMGSFPEYRSEFRAYQDFMVWCPEEMSIYVTETNPCAGGQAWADQNTGWVRAAYDEVNRWNEAHPRKAIRCLALYRWPRYDPWSFAGKQGVIEDFQQAVAAGYKWRAPEEVPEPEPEPARARVAAALDVVAASLVSLADLLRGGEGSGAGGAV